MNLRFLKISGVFLGLITGSFILVFAIFEFLFNRRLIDIKHEIRLIDICNLAIGLSIPFLVSWVNNKNGTRLHKEMTQEAVTKIIDKSEKLIDKIRDFEREESLNDIEIKNLRLEIKIIQGSLNCIKEAIKPIRCKDIETKSENFTSSWNDFSGFIREELDSNPKEFKQPFVRDVATKMSKLNIDSIALRNEICFS
jgi:hypothetical protein